MPCIPSPHQSAAMLGGNTGAGVSVHEYMETEETRERPRKTGWQRERERNGLSCETGAFSAEATWVS